MKLLLTNNKELVVTKSSPLYKSETGIDNLLIYIPKSYEGANVINLDFIVGIDKMYQESEDDDIIQKTDYYKVVAKQTNYALEVVRDNTEPSSSQIKISTVLEVMGEDFDVQVGDYVIHREKIYRKFPYNESDKEESNWDKEGYLSVTIPVTTTLTLYEDLIYIWAILMGTDNGDLIFKSSEVGFMVLPSNSLNS